MSSEARNMYLDYERSYLMNYHARDYGCIATVIITIHELVASGA